MTEARTRRWRPLELVNVTSPFFDSRGIDAPRLNAELLLAHALGWHRLDLYTRFETVLSDGQVEAFRELVRRRSRREPLQHILGRAEFRSLEIRCDARAFTPRPETELVVEEALRLARGIETPAVADIGTGSGCVAVSLALELPGAQVAATDISLPALEVALGNVEAHGLTGRVRLLEGDLAAPLLAEGYAGGIDLIVCNPPYVPSGEIERLQPEVRDFDPRVALDGGPDGLDFYRRFFKEVRPLLKARGAAVLEMGERGAEPVRGLAEASGWRCLNVREDYGKVPRVFSAECVAGAGGAL